MRLHHILFLSFLLYRCNKRRWLIVTPLCFLLSFFAQDACYAQSFVFAQLTGSPVNTTGWTLTGNARVGNIKSSDNAEIILCDTHNSETGSIFYNRSIDLSKCNQWKAEFDFRIFDGTAADGIAFCFLETPPSGFISGEGIGIPAGANGLKVVFDTYNNCADNHSTDVPKIELRWDGGYNECSSQPTLTNSNGTLSFIRSDAYNHAVITYNAGNIGVSVNNTLYLTGFQSLSLTGYLGFTSGTGGNYDNHSIKDVIIYANVPTAAAGADQTVCAGQTVSIGSPDNAAYQYQWSPADGLSSATVANPVVTIPNPTNESITKMYAVTTLLPDGSGCTSTDSVNVTVLTLAPPSVSIASSAVRYCQGDSLPTFTATAVAGGSSPHYRWLVNDVAEGTDSVAFLPDTLLNGDVVRCTLTNNESCAAIATNTSNTVSLPVFPSPTVDAGLTATIDYGSYTQLNAVVTGNVSNVSWNPVAGLNNSGIANPIARPQSTTLYTVSVQTADACAASDTVTVKIISKGVAVPTAFTPDGNGNNDIFKPIVLGASADYHFIVFNRWGQRVFISEKPGSGWDGTLHDRLQPSGTYLWTLACTLDTNVHISKSGTVVMIR